MEEEKLLKMGGTLSLVPVKVDMAAAAAAEGSDLRNDLKRSPARGSFDASVDRM